ncbi:cell division protein SepF [Gemella sp. GH3]|uniref:cell division protein SepF n=1 Tax=unclassified Gemella TaxID=2624949 RepID=UPI0015D01A3E|nr:MULTISPECIES: cell division protein SepF [unclassified Gemella]MBF0713621.1 cell division protein SepF [Gemella sp. GH3.1]NYS50573.1 cell division protein SepF [Gemella sp. GH3]
MSVLKKFNDMFSSEEDEIYEEREVSQSVERVAKSSNKKDGKLVNKQSLINKGEVILREPLVFADSKDIIDDIKANKVVILNLTKLDLQTADRLLDFIYGGMYAIDAKLKIIGEEIYLCVPKGVEVAGEFSEGEY